MPRFYVTITTLFRKRILIAYLIVRPIQGCVDNALFMKYQGLSACDEIKKR